MKKIAVLSLVAAASLTLVACSKSEEAANNVVDANVVEANAVADVNVVDANVADANVADNAANAM